MQIDIFLIANNDLPTVGKRPKDGKSPPAQPLCTPPRLNTRPNRLFRLPLSPRRGRERAGGERGESEEAAGKAISPVEREQALS